MPIVAMHTLVYSDDAPATRAFSHDELDHARHPTASDR